MADGERATEMARRQESVASAQLNATRDAVHEVCPLLWSLPVRRESGAVLRVRGRTGASPACILA